MKKILIGVCILLCAGILICFIPFNANKFIPLIKQQVAEQYGLNIETTKLTFKVGPSVIIKSPSVMLNYNQKEKLASLKGVKLKVAIFPLLKHEIKIKDVRIDDVDSYLKLDKNNNLEVFNYLKPVNNINSISKIRLKKYTNTLITPDEQNYIFSGSELLISDFKPNNHIKLSSHGKLLIEGIKYIDYDFSVLYDGLNFKTPNNIDVIDFLKQLKEKQANASIVTDLKIKNTKEGLKTDGVISIDKLTFVVNDKKLPYSNASFTILGNKVSVSSLIYTNTTDKIKINGFVTLTDNPNFNISVKSDKIDLKDLLYFARLCSDISEYNQVKDINGTLHSNFTLKGTLKHLKSSGFFKISNANVIMDKIRITNINSDIDFSANKILIKTTKAYVNDAPVVVTGDIISNKFNLNLIVNKFKLNNAKFNKCKINSGIISVVANISGSYKNLVPRIEAELTNIVGGYEVIKFRANRFLFKSADKHSGEILISNLITTLPRTNAITIPNLKAHLTETDISINDFYTYSADSKINMAGSVLNYNEPDKLTFSFKGHGFVNPNGIFKIKGLDSVFPVLIEFNGDKAQQNIKAQLLSQNPKSIVSIAQPVIINFVSKLEKQELKISDCSINTYKGLFEQNQRKNIANSTKLCVLTGSIEKLYNPIFKNIKINILKTCPINISHYMAKINGNLVINGNVCKPEIVGNIKVPILSDKYGCFTAKNIALGLTKNIINFDCANVKIFESSLSFVGTAEAKLTKNIKIKTLNIKSKDIDLDNLSLLLLIAKDCELKAIIENGTMFSESVSIKTPADSIMLSDMNASFNLNNNNLNISSLTGNMYNGKIAGHINLNAHTGNYTGLIQGRGLSAGPVLKSMTNLRENICGKLDFDMNINSSIKSKFLKHANLKFIIHDGQMSTLGKVEHLLYAQNIVADSMLKTSLAVITRAIASKDTGLFKYLNGIIVINNDVATIHSIKMLGPNMSLYITGHYGIMSNIANATILGRLSNTMVSSLGNFGTFTMNKFRIALTGEGSEEVRVLQNGVENIPQLPQRNTKEFRAIISGPAEAKTSVRSFMWISESEKEYRTREVPQSNIGIPKFIENLPY